MALVGYDSSSSESESEDRPAPKSVIKRAPKKIQAFKPLQKTYINLYGDDDEDELPIPAKVGSKRPASEVISIKSRSGLLNQLSRKKARPVIVGKLPVPVEEATALKDRVRADMRLEESMAKAKAANRFFDNLSKPKVSEDNLLVDSTYQDPSKKKWQTDKKQTYMNRKKLSGSAISIIQADIAENSARAELKTQQLLAKYMKKEKDRTTMPTIADISGIRDNDKDVDTNFFTFTNKKLTAGEVIGTLEEMGVDADHEGKRRALPNPFAPIEEEESDDEADQILGYTDTMSGQSYNLYNLPWDGKTEKINARSEEDQRNHKLGNEQMDMQQIYRLSGNRKIKKEKIEFKELTSKAQLADQAHVQKHLKVFNEIATSGHTADRRAEENDIGWRSKSRHQMTWLMNEAVRNRERLTNFWQESREGAAKKKEKYGWGFGFVN